MADSLTATFKMSLDAQFTNTLTDALTSFTAPHTFSVSHSTTDGTTTTKADKIWKSEDRSLSGATSETIDVYDLASINIGAGAGKDCFGNSWATVEIVGVFIFNDSTSTGNLTIGNDGTTACWNSIFDSDDEGKIILKPGGVFAIWNSIADASYAVADTSNHLLKLTSSATLTYDIWIIARSA